MSPILVTQWNDPSPALTGTLSPAEGEKDGVRGGSGHFLEQPKNKPPSQEV
jgi:hypothetical protein